MRTDPRRNDPRAKRPSIQPEFPGICGTVEPLGTDTSPLRTVSYVPTKFQYVSLKKKLYNTDPL